MAPSTGISQGPHPAIPATARLGIGIVTFNRAPVLRETIAAVRRHTDDRDAILLVADDGSTDDTVAMLRAARVPVVTGPNMGIAWNKNRALYLLAQTLRCEVVILLEDDTQPTADGWEATWAGAARLWGHVNYAGAWLRPAFVGGRGTPAQPFLSTAVTAQCSAYTREALDYAGYFDSRFKGYGHEHVEHTRRLIRAGFGGTDQAPDGREEVIYRLIAYGVKALEVESFADDAQIARNLEVALPLMSDSSYRAPWRDTGELRQFRAEIESSLGGWPAGFDLTERPVGAGLAGRPVWGCPYESTLCSRVTRMMPALPRWARRWLGANPA